MDLRRAVSKTSARLQFITVALFCRGRLHLFLLSVQTLEKGFFRLLNGPGAYSPSLHRCQFACQCCHRCSPCSLVFVSGTATFRAPGQMGIQSRPFVVTQFAGGRSRAKLEELLMRAHWSNASISHRITFHNTRTIACSIPLR